MSQPWDICIRGDGIVGQTLALLLARDNLRIALVGPATPPTSSDVRAYALNTRAHLLLNSLRCWPDDAHATAVTRMRVDGDDGGATVFDAATLGVAALTWIVDVPALQSLLADAVRFQSRITRTDAAVPAKLTVVCEGRASHTRQDLGVEFDITSYPQTAVAARLQCERAHDQMARQWFKGQSIVALLPLDGPSGHSVGLVWSAPHLQAQELLALEADEFCQRLEQICGSALGAMTLASARASWRLQQARARQWVGVHQGQSWALAGDAAHNVHPLAGQGLNLGLADAQALAEVLHQRPYWRSPGDMRLLRAYARARAGDTLTTGAVMDSLQFLFWQSSPLWQSARNWGMLSFEHSGPLKGWIARQAMGLR
jgi:2-polyprenyl-6-methoxyphenol hydroxylase-like FAD-dependent oxidoreductase